MKVDIVRVILSLSKDLNLDQFTVRYILHRFNNEGICFLTKTLPKLSKAVLHSLEKGYFVRPTDFQHKGKSLRYFRSFLNGIFDPSTGRVLPSPDPVDIYRIRQFCDYFYKLSLDFKESEVRDAQEKFLQNDKLDQDIDWAFVDRLRKDLETYYPEITKPSVDEILKNFNPRPGPGTFSTSIAYRDKWYYRRHTDYSVDPALYNYSYARRPMKNAKVPKLVHDTQVSEVLFVPKDSRGPRTIVREPFQKLCYQMSFNDFICPALNRASYGRVNFVDQRVNQQLAMKSSVTREYATLDLKDASDMIRYDVIRRLTSNIPSLRFFVNKTRTSCTVLPDGTIHKLNKLSGMGSGLTFPFLSMLVYLTSVRTLADNFSLTYDQAKRLVYVYGDDLVVPTISSPRITLGLSRVGFVVNTAKSFRNSHFRESCGADYYYGNDVRPVRFKMASSGVSVASHSLQFSKKSAAITQLNDHCRQLVFAQLENLCEYYYSLLEKEVGSLPYYSGNRVIIGRFTLNSDIPLRKYIPNKVGNYPDIRCLVPSSISERIPEADPYIYLAASLKRLASVDERKNSFLCSDSGRSVEFGEVIVPRRIKLKRQKVNTFSLCS